MIMTTMIEYEIRIGTFHFPHIPLVFVPACNLILVSRPDLHLSHFSVPNLDSDCMYSTYIDDST